MWTRKRTPVNRGFRPEADVLECRQMLSAVVSGTDSKGDTWSLRLVGPGTLSVVKQNGADGTPAALTSATDISTITIAGTNPLTSRLVGNVTAGPNSDGRVFFQNMTQLANRSEKYTGSGDGLLSIDMPNFYLGNTTPAGTAPTSTPTISIPDGVDTLDFGGVDTSVNQPPTASATNDQAVVSLGLPTFGGTRIIINKSISSSETGPAASGSTTPTIVQHGVLFAVSGRLDLFQANEIDGDTNNPPGQFLPASSTTTTSAGGTVVFSSTPGFGSNFPFTSTLFPNALTKGAVTGAIGNVRVGGNATNFSTFVFDPTFSGGDKIANYSVGGETNNVLLVAPSGARNVYFGKGMDTVTILAHVINALQANRGALNSNVFADRSISRANFGGDVVNTKLLAGYQQNYTNILSTVIGLGLGSGASNAPNPLNAQSFGGMTLHVAGSVTNSVFAASVEPFQNNYSKFGDPNQLVLTGGNINAKIEGTITNTVATPNTPNQAVFAAKVTSYKGPVVPPNVPEAPYATPQPSHLPGIQHPSRSLIKVSTPTPTPTPTTTTTAASTTKAV